jgi:hypothetical protein
MRFIINTQTIRNHMPAQHSPDYFNVDKNKPVISARENAV